jgi:UDP-2,3-diacylglucosamine pyrophosphatase LpxH
MAKKSVKKSPPALVDPVTSQLTTIGQQSHRPQVILPVVRPVAPASDANVPIAVVVSDTHLSTSPPSLHADNPNWFGHIERNFEWLFAQASEYAVPILIAGDVFDRAICDSKLLNFAIDLFSRSPQPIYTVPGNHDLPFHSIDRVDESGYANLMKAGVIIDCSETQNYTRNNKSVQIHGYHWLKSLDSDIYQNSDAIQIALVHRMITDGKAGWYPGCEQHVLNSVMREFKRYFHYTVFGDNHVPFVNSYNQGEQYMGGFVECDRRMQVLNPGAFIRRTRGDLELSTCAYLLQSRTAVKLEVPKATATAGEMRGNVESRATMDEPENLHVASFASLPSFLSDDGTSIVPDIAAQYRRYVSTLHAPAEVHKKLEDITGITPH